MENPGGASGAAGYDETEHRYYVLSSDIPGLNTEAETFEAFTEAAQDAAPV